MLNSMRHKSNNHSIHSLLRPVIKCRQQLLELQKSRPVLGIKKAIEPIKYSAAEAGLHVFLFFYFQFESLES